jgi:hypothetical protein
VSFPCRSGDIEHPLSFFSHLRQTLVHQFQRDENIRTFLKTIRNAFEIIVADILKSIQPASKQAKLLDEMLQCVSKCAEFIESYAEGCTCQCDAYIRVDETVEHYCTTLTRLRRSSHMPLSPEAAVLQTWDDVRDVNTQLTEMLNQTLETGA